MTLKPFWHDLAIFPSEPLLVPRSKRCGKHQKGSTCKYPLGTYSVQGTVALEYTGFLRQCFCPQLSRERWWNRLVIVFTAFGST